MHRLVRRVVLILVALGLGVAGSTHAVAQVPPHQPGEICFTPQFWCWANPPGPPGYPCGCPTEFGYIPGILG